jgi:hypothetical protein
MPSTSQQKHPGQRLFRDGEGAGGSAGGEAPSHLARLIGCSLECRKASRTRSLRNCYTTLERRPVEFDDLLSQPSERLIPNK